MKRLVFFFEMFNFCSILFLPLHETRRVSLMTLSPFVEQNQLTASSKTSARKRTMDVAKTTQTNLAKSFEANKRVKTNDRSAGAVEQNVVMDLTSTQKENHPDATRSRKTPDVGDRLKVFWKDDKKWYAGIVRTSRTSVEEDTGATLTEHEIKYDDGDCEWLYLKQERYELLEAENLSRKRCPPRPTTSTKKRRKLRKKSNKKVVMSSSDEEDEYVPSGDESSEEEYVPDAPVEPLNEPTKTKRTTPKRPRPKTTMQTPKSTRKSSSSTKQSLPSGVLALGQHEHHVNKNFSFLWPDKIKDKKGRRPDHPDYDARTLYVPPQFLKSKSCTPAHEQWWEIKSENMDAILFFKVGKFYEIFHMDADIAVKETSATFMKGSRAHAGFPEAAYAKFSQQLVERGYRVVRVEQTETPGMLKQANKQRRSQGKRNRKVVLREVCSVLTPGTRTNNVMDQRGGKSMYGKNAPANAVKRGYDGIREPEKPRHLLALFEDHVVATNDGDLETSKLSRDRIVSAGFCLVDAASATFTIGHLMDFAFNRTELTTLLEATQPCEIVYFEKSIGPETLSVLKSSARGAVFSPMPSTVLSSSQANKTTSLSEESISALKHRALLGDETSSWPHPLRDLLRRRREDDANVAMDANRALCSVGALVTYLKRCKVAADLVSQRRIMWSPHTHREMGHDAKASSVVSTTSMSGPMTLDGAALQTLEVLRNESSGSLEGSLLHYVDSCVTPFGKTELRRWMTNPLTNVVAMNERLDVVDILRTDASCITKARGLLRDVPNMVSLLSRIGSMAGAHRKLESENDSSFHHPDTRAIFYEGETYAKRKVQAFFKMLDGLLCSSSVIRTLKKGYDLDDSSKSGLLGTLLSVPVDEIDERVRFFKSSFNASEARKKGIIVPLPGVNAEYDDAKKAVKSAMRAIDEERRNVRAQLGLHEEVTFFGNFKHRFQLQVPERTQVPDDWILKSKKKGYRRYWSPEVIELTAHLERAEDALDKALKSNMWQLFNKFFEHNDLWQRVVSAIESLDCFLAIAHLSLHASGSMCRPSFVEANGDGRPVLRFRQGRHPCVAASLDDENDFIPNNLFLGGDVPSVLLLTGPNMGGKSTLLRQACVMVILAQIGSYVPAAQCSLTPVDRIFTRLGASDRIMSGQSTFFVELSEASTIMSKATKNSLVIIDELGRGTSTFDGAAIASAVLRNLATEVRCRAMFATHYYNLVDRFDVHPDVQLGHMSSHVDTNSDAQRITFLYLLESGASPKSYGINVAHLARIPDDVIKSASRISKTFELSLLRRSIVAETQSLHRALLEGDKDTSEKNGGVTQLTESNACLLNLWHRAKDVLAGLDA